MLLQIVVTSPKKYHLRDRVPESSSESLEVNSGEGVSDGEVKLKDSEKNEPKLGNTENSASSVKNDSKRASEKPVNKNGGDDQSPTPVKRSKLDSVVNAKCNNAKNKGKKVKQEADELVTSNGSNEGDSGTPKVDAAVKIEADDCKVTNKTNKTKKGTQRSAVAECDDSKVPAGEMSKLAFVNSVVNAKNNVSVTSPAKKCKNTTVVAESAESGVNGAKKCKNTTKSGVNDDVETLSVTSSEESVKVLGVERPGQSRKQTVAKSLSDHAAKIVNKPSERKNTNIQQSRQVELMNNDSKENKGVIGIRGKSRNARTAQQTSLPLLVTSKVTENQQQSQVSSGAVKVKVDSDSDSSLDREEAEYQSKLQQATCSKGKKPKSEKQQKKVQQERNGSIPKNLTLKG